MNRCAIPRVYLSLAGLDSPANVRGAVVPTIARTASRPALSPQSGRPGSTTHRIDLLSRRGGTQGHPCPTQNFVLQNFRRQTGRLPMAADSWESCMRYNSIWSRSRTGIVRKYSQPGAFGDVSNLDLSLNYMHQTRKTPACPYWRRRPHVE